jgi:hypothetical protein
VTAHATQNLEKRTTKVRYQPARRRFRAQPAFCSSF